ncbi:MAG: hypothetical protein VX278_08645, partial [Myxococcota bacterium]|nr:hypothetical protein [Myxococcota bacterium]
VCCSALGSTFDYLETPLWSIRTSVFGYLGAQSIVSDLELLPLQLCAFAGITLLFYALRRPFGAFSAAIATISLFSYPFFAYAIRRWDVYASSMLLMGGLLYIHSRKQNRITFVYLLCMLPIFAFWSPRATDNLLLLFFFGCTTLSFWAIQKNKGRLSLLFPLIAVGALCIAQLPHASTDKIQYYLQEIGNRPSEHSSFYFWTYVLYLHDRGLGPWNSWLYWWLLIPTLFTLRHRRHRAWMASGLIILVILSLIPKKNHYYIFIIWPYLAVYVAMGLYALPSWLRVSTGIYFLFMNIFPYQAQSNPNGSAASIMGRRPWIYAMRTQDFQTYDGGLNIHPRRNRWAQNVHKTLQFTPSCTYIVSAYGGLETDELQIRSPSICPRFHSLPDKKHLSKSGWVFLAPSPSRRDISQILLEKGFVQNASFLDAEEQRIWVYKRPDSWFPQ